MHYCFLEKENKVIYFEEFYTELKKVTDIKEVEKYIDKKLAK